MYTCRECEREINQATEICPYCGTDLSIPPDADGLVAATKRTPAQILLRWVGLLGAMAALLWGFLWYILPARNGNPALEAETRATGALLELRAALGNYAEAQGGSYPVSLEPLGDRARIPAQMAQSLGYQLQYVPGPAGADGLVHNYALLARAGNFGYRNFYTDESGVLRATRENRAASAQDPPVGTAGAARVP
jgi:hypothetical protein